LEKATATAAKIELRGISMVFGSRKAAASVVALDDLSFKVQDGQFVCLLGPSGCGKSTVLNLIAGFARPTSGLILLEGAPVTRPGPDRGVVFQEPLLFPWLTVLENVTFGPRMHGVASNEYLPKAARLIEQVGLSGFERHRPYELSGGMKQRAALARAWIGSPRVLLMDEPFAALDAQTRLMMQEQLVHLWEHTKTTVVFITHDVEEAILLADRILVMASRPGRIKADIAVPLQRPRSYELLISSEEAAQLKRHIFHLVREEALKTMEGTRQVDNVPAKVSPSHPSMLLHDGKRQQLELWADKVETSSHDRERA
jgi:NitT/TauT family transport system ATP-binding protein